MLDTLSEDTSTASNAEPGTPRRAFRSLLFQLGSGAPLMNSDEPLSASTIPCFLSARRITWFWAEKPLISKLALSRNQAPIGGSDAPPLAALWLAGQTYAFAVLGAVKRITWSTSPAATSS